MTPRDIPKESSSRKKVLSIILGSILFGIAFLLTQYFEYLDVRLKIIGIFPFLLGSTYLIVNSLK